MTPKIFLTGATGFIGGTVFERVHNAHPDFDYTLLVRDENRGKPISAKYSNVKFVYGTLEDSDAIKKAASEADIVIHTALSADDGPSAKAIAAGLAAGHTPENPGYWIHLSGSGILIWYDLQNGRFGEAPLAEETYNDVKGIDRILNLPDSAIHRDIEKTVQETNSDAVKTIIVSPPTVYGRGSGTTNTRSIQVPDLARAALQKGYVPIAGAGKTEWDNVHVDDLADLFVKFVDATQDPSKRSNPEIVGRHGYYFARQAEHKWVDVAQWVAEEATRQGYLSEPATKSLTQKEIESTGYVAGITWGVNSKGESERAKKYLGWEPKAPSLKDTIAEVVEVEAKLLGLTPKHAPA